MKTQKPFSPNRKALVKAQKAYNEADKAFQKASKAYRKAFALASAAAQACTKADRKREACLAKAFAEARAYTEAVANARAQANEAYGNSQPFTRPEAASTPPLSKEALDEAHLRAKLTVTNVDLCARLGCCRAGMDREPTASDCPQIRDGEPMKTGRLCPLAVPGDYGE